MISHCHCYVSSWKLFKLSNDINFTVKLSKLFQKSPVYYSNNHKNTWLVADIAPSWRRLITASWKQEAKEETTVEDF